MRVNRAVLVCAVVLALAGCSSPATSSAGVSVASSQSASCFRDDLTTVQPGLLTIATGEPSYEPWVMDDDPASGEGFEAAVAVAAAAILGFTTEDIVWTRTTFDGSIAPGAKPFDWNLQQFSVTADREKSVDFSTPYYASTQAVVAREDSPIAGASRMDQLSGAMLGAAIGTTSLAAAQGMVTDGDVVVYNDTSAAVAALQQSRVDGVVVDLPTAFQVVEFELPDGVLVGQIPDPEGGTTDDLAILLADDSPLTPCTSLAVDTLRDDGTLATLEAAWLGDVSEAPVLR